ncbi:MAG TPA: hypothetical protein P5123_05395 [Spirochaetota bacterium]|nr:hypothetical protein [Spirochaetota bacterium]
MKRNNSIISSTIRQYSFMAGLLISASVAIFAVLLFFTYGKIETAASLAAFDNGYRFTELLRQSSSLNELKQKASSSDSIYGFTLFKRSRDDRFGLPVFSTEKIITELDSQNIISDSDPSIFEKAFEKTVSDKKIYSDKDKYYTIIYFPFDTDKERYIARVLVAVDNIAMIKINSSRHFIRAIKLLLTISVLAFAVFFFLSILFGIKIRNKFVKINKDVSEAIANREKISDTNVEMVPLANSINSLIDDLLNQKKAIDKLKLLNDFDEIFKKGVEFLKIKQYEAAKHIFHTLILVKPDSFGSVFNLGVIYAKQKDYPQSLSMFQSALSINPDDKLSLQYCEKISKLAGAPLTNEKCS